MTLLPTLDNTYGDFYLPAGRVIGYAVDLALHRGVSIEDVDALLG